MDIQIMDASALTAYLRNEPGRDVVLGMITDDNNQCLVHAINFCEVYYDALRVRGQEVAEAETLALQQLGVTVRTDMEPAFWQRVGQLKVNPGKISLADCFALALALETGGTLVTSDHHEFDAVARLGLCPITFIR